MDLFLLAVFLAMLCLRALCRGVGGQNGASSHEHLLEGTKALNVLDSNSVVACHWSRTPVRHYMPIQEWLASIDAVHLHLQAGCALIVCLADGAAMVDATTSEPSAEVSTAASWVS